MLRRYEVKIYQHGIYVQDIGNWSVSLGSAKQKAIKMFKEDNKGVKGITAIPKLKEENPNETTNLHLRTHTPTAQAQPKRHLPQMREGVLLLEAVGEVVVHAASS